MRLRTLFVMDPLDRIDLNGDSTYMQMRDAQSRGWPVYCCEPADLYSLQGQAWARATAVRIADSDPVFRCESPRDVPLSDFEVVWMRKDPPFDMNYVFATYLVEQTPRHTVVLNNPSGIRDSNEKMVALRWPELCPPTLVTRQFSGPLIGLVQWKNEWLSSLGMEMVVVGCWYLVMEIPT